MKNIKKLCIFCALFLITLLFNIKDTKAMSKVFFFFDYNTTYFNNKYSSTLFEKLEELKNHIEEENTYNRNYVISLNNSKIHVGLLLAQNARPNDYYAEYFILSYQPVLYRSTYSLDYYIGTGNAQYTTRAEVEITISDFLSNNTSSFYTTLDTYLNSGKSTNYNNLFISGTPISGNESWYSNKNYQIYTYDYMSFIYYSSLPLKLNTNKNSNETNGITIENACNTTNQYYYDNEMIFNDIDLSTTLNCGDTFKTYHDYISSIPQYTEQNTYTNINKQIQSLDIYYNTNTTKTYEETFKLEYTLNQGGSNAYEVTGYKVYGKQCNYLNNSNINATCWWEEINHSYWTISNDTYTTEENNYTIEFKFNLDVSNTNYEDIKLAIIQMPSNFNLTISTKEESKKYNSIDLNTMYYDYCKETITNNLIDTKNLGILVDNKPSETDIEYRFYTKRKIKEYDEIYFYYFNKIRNEIGETQIQTLIYETYKIEETQYYIETGTINLGTNSNNKIFIFTNEYRSANYDIYFNTKVYYTKQDNIQNNIVIDYTGTDGTIQTTIDVRINNDFIQQEYENSTSVNFDNIIEMIESYEQYKNEWLELFYSIYRPLPTIIKQIFILMYFMAHCYGIYLIFKD